MTNYEKVIKNMDSHSLAYMLYKSNACPFPYYEDYCGKCEFYTECHEDDFCKFPNMQMKAIIKWLEQEIEE